MRGARGRREQRCRRLEVVVLLHHWRRAVLRVGNHRLGRRRGWYLVLRGSVVLRGQITVPGGLHLRLVASVPPAWLLQNVERLTG